MTRPRRYLLRMIIFLAAVLGIGAALSPILKDAFLASPGLNGLIIGILLFGIGYAFRQVILLGPEAEWIESFRLGKTATADAGEPRLLAPLVATIGERKRIALSPLAMRSMLDGIASRLDEFRDISRYLIGLLIFLGLLGTFWGLLQTIGAVRDVIGGLSAGNGDLNSIFQNLKNGLQAPLGGMGTSFSSSMFGLAGSLVLGFLDLQAGQAQNRFFNELEDWLSGHVRLASGPSLQEGEASVPAYLQALIEQTADNLENLQRSVARNDEARRGGESSMLVLAEKIGALSDQMRAEQQLMIRLAEGQMEMRPILSRLGDVVAGSSGGLDEATRTHIRNLDVYMAKLLDDSATGRTQIIQELRSEIRLLARTIAALAEDSAAEPPRR
ncbi:MAG: flagellar motor protein MotA [Alphaproteobacteria bacterium]